MRQRPITYYPTSGIAYLQLRLTRDTIKNVRASNTNPSEIKWRGKPYPDFRRLNQLQIHLHMIFQTQSLAMRRILHHRTKNSAFADQISQYIWDYDTSLRPVIFHPHRDLSWVQSRHKKPAYLFLRNTSNNNNSMSDCNHGRDDLQRPMSDCRL